MTNKCINGTKETRNARTIYFFLSYMSLLKLFWKAHLFLILIFFPLSLLSMFVLPNPSWVEYVVRILFLVFPIFGLVGFVFNKPIYRQWVWKVVFFFSVIYLSWIQIIRFLNSYGWCESNTCVLLSLLFGFVFYVPLLIGLFQYAFSCKEIWERK